ncbi:exodeoxyribonuclease V subunit alpha [Reinekea marinisedimentorum]|uniref:RecBCD enzyme subunit RecD n=1 Tax=Reinekea marinisedimentorum TaxID=230495 RepID=A0A4R3I7G4_9GAMM|nr:exodeoxyribonuclease V subunit alpha [Reinekea marinisedimentorum]TCS41117.1 DNA helicase/exodeoxyribonuclease V alpha subunit [Reinekea marinisedimentorum]
MSELLPSPFQAVDRQLAQEVCQLLKIDDALLRQSIMAMSFALQQGHSCLALHSCLQESPYRTMAEYGFESFPPAAQWQAHLEQLPIRPEHNAPVVFYQGRLYLRRYFQFETELASFIASHENRQPALTSETLKLARQLLGEFFSTEPGQTNWQQVAAANALLSSFTTIIGGPGTGKTYTVTRILALLAMLSETTLKIRLAAPTGKAAQRLAESIRQAKANMNLDMITAQSIPDEAATLHRLLGVIPNSIHFRHNRENPIDADVVLVDEVSMVDLPLMTRFIRALKPETRVILLGDADQLPSVAAGSVLADITSGQRQQYSAKRCAALKQLGINLPAAAEGQATLDRVTALVHSRRFSEHSGVGALARAVLAGNCAASTEVFAQFNDLRWVPDDQFDAQLNDWLRQHIQPIAQQGSVNEAYAKLQQFRLLCATREGERGVKELNERITRLVNTERTPFFKGQPVMVTQNHYGLKLYNGDIGLLWPNDEGHLMVWFEAENGYRAVTPGRLPAFETVYAMTIHKTQGSEFDHVVVVLPGEKSSLLNRELIYTGLTRAKLTVTVVGAATVWQQGVSQRVERWAGLSEQIAERLAARNTK